MRCEQCTKKHKDSHYSFVISQIDICPRERYNIPKFEREEYKMSAQSTSYEQSFCHCNAAAVSSARIILATLRLFA